MLLSKTVNVKWNQKTKKHYVDLGYNYTKMGDSFEVNVNDLTDGSNVMVDIQCDYCGDVYKIYWYSYKQLKKKILDTDCCGNPECTSKKAQETIRVKYGVHNFRNIPGINEKIAKTNMEKYGAENPFGSKEIIKKIMETNIEKYGVEWYTQTDEYKERYKKTCMEKYGVPNYSYTDDFMELMSGKNSPNWKGDDIKIPREYYRDNAEYRAWRKSVFDRDYYTCQCCGARSGCGKSVVLCAHHIENWSSNIEKRYDINNGITLCKDCHSAFHSCYGIKNNNVEQLNDFIYLNNKDELDEKIC